MRMRALRRGEDRTVAINWQMQSSNVSVSQNDRIHTFRDTICLLVPVDAVGTPQSVLTSRP